MKLERETSGTGLLALLLSMRSTDLIQNGYIYYKEDGME
jgi:hypothetical protein